MDDFIARIMNGYDCYEPFYGDQQTAFTSTLLTGQNTIVGTVGTTRTFPSLPTGVTGYIVMSTNALSSNGSGPLILGKAINLGSIDISGASGTFSAGSSMPTVTEGNNSNQTYSSVMAEVTTAISSNAGTLTITYKANDGTTGNTTTAQTITNSAVAHTCGTITLNTGHWGVSQITASARAAGSSPTGVIKFWGVLPICMVHQGYSASIPAFRNLISSTINPMRLGAADVVKIFSLGATGVRGLEGGMNIVGDS